MLNKREECIMITAKVNEKKSAKLRNAGREEGGEDEGRGEEEGEKEGGGGMACMWEDEKRLLFLCSQPLL